MLGTLRVVSLEEYKDYINDRSEVELSPEELGKLTFNNKGCTACHTLDGSRLVGPSLKGVYGRTEELSDGTTVTVDENYIRESILHPAAKIVKGFEGVVMPSYEGQLSDEEIQAVIAYFKTL
ncbi:MAG: cytochrome c [Bdellovibrionales bacterium]|nr:cytochrome c [Bdellovibrionales bacterium]